MTGSAAILAPGSRDDAILIHLVGTEALDDVLAGLDERHRTFARAAGFRAKAGQVALLPDADGAIGAVLFGLGKPGEAERGPLAPGKLARALPAGVYQFAPTTEDHRLATLGFALGGYRYDRYRKPKDERPQLVAPSGVPLAEVLRAADAVAFVRDLVNTPANDFGPAELAEAARTLAASFDAAFRVVDGEDLERDFPMVHAVGRASSRSPRLIDFTWGDKAATKVTLVGKGVVFDTGGLDIKPAAAMALMKKDMGGAANVLGLARMIMDAGLDLRLRVLAPAVENAISGSAFRPGDILRSRKGLTVEIGNTDAEGRLVLADALALADADEPELIVSMATLTGAARVALGPDLPALFTRSDSLAAALAEAAAAEADPLWRLPLWAPYDALLASKIADVNHVSGGPHAGAITAALFLHRFVDKAKAYAHFDMFAWNPTERPWGPAGGEAQAIRALFRHLAEAYPPAGARGR